jgi:CheY-like chemotaxis protein
MTRQKILWIDADVEKFTSALSSIARDHNLTVAYTVEEAFIALPREQWDLIIMELSLPQDEEARSMGQHDDKGGFELLPLIADTGASLVVLSTLQFENHFADELRAVKTFAYLRKVIPTRKFLGVVYGMLPT